MKCFLRLRPFIDDIYTYTWRSIKITVLIVREIKMLHLNHEILLSGKPILKVTISYLTGSFQRNENNLIKGANVFRYHYARDIKLAGWASSWHSIHAWPVLNDKWSKKRALSMVVINFTCSQTVVNIYKHTLINKTTTSKLSLWNYVCRRIVLQCEHCS